MSRNAALGYDERIKSLISPPKHTFRRFRAKGSDGAMSRDRGVAAPRNVLIPAPETMVQGPIDAAFGFKHWHQFKRIAGGDGERLAARGDDHVLSVLSSQIQLFKLGELDAAKTRISGKERAGA
jgi:hypothetical protein